MMNKGIKTVITYTINDDELREAFKSFLEKHCNATREKDQSTYVSSMEREEILLKLNNFALGKEDFVKLYFCPDEHISTQSYFLKRIEYPLN